MTIAGVAVGTVVAGRGVGVAGTISICDVGGVGDIAAFVALTIRVGGENHDCAEGMIVFSHKPIVAAKKRTKLESINPANLNIKNLLWFLGGKRDGNAGFFSCPCRAVDVRRADAIDAALL